MALKKECPEVPGTITLELGWHEYRSIIAALHVMYAITTGRNDTLQECMDAAVGSQMILAPTAWDAHNWIISLIDQADLNWPNLAGKWVTE